MAINKQGVCYVLANYRGFFYVHIIYIVNEVNAFALATICRLYNPNVLFAFVLFKLLVMIVEIPKFVR